MLSAQQHGAELIEEQQVSEISSFMEDLDSQQAISSQDTSG